MRSPITPSRIYGAVVTLVVSGLLATAIRIEPITSSFTSGGHLVAVAGITAVGAFFAAVFLFE